MRRRRLFEMLRDGVGRGVDCPQGSVQDVQLLAGRQPCFSRPGEPLRASEETVGLTGMGEAPFPFHGMDEPSVFSRLRLTPSCDWQTQAALVVDEPPADAKSPPARATVKSHAVSLHACAAA
jgi:hypothetical protein